IGHVLALCVVIVLIAHPAMHSHGRAPVSDTTDVTSGTAEESPADTPSELPAKRSHPPDCPLCLSQDRINLASPVDLTALNPQLRTRLAWQSAKYELVIRPRAHHVSGRAPPHVLS